MSAKIVFTDKYSSIISIDNLLLAWREFVRGKKKKKDVQEFERNLMDNILTLHYELRDGMYRHSKYEVFYISDPKPRTIHKAKVRDRLLHHAIYRKLYPFFDRTFISHSYSCRLNKGTHKALDDFRDCINSESKNHTKTVWILKCDIKKFFASIDQKILLNILERYIEDENILRLLEKIINSFNSGKAGVGLPLGNLTSQLLVNIYMNRFDQFVKHRLKAKGYIRYADDFMIISSDKKWLCSIIHPIFKFLWQEMRLSLHRDKVSIMTMASGVDYLGWVNFPRYRVLRTVSKRRMYKNLREKMGKEETLQSYLGLLSHGNMWGEQEKILRTYSKPR